MKKKLLDYCPRSITTWLYYVVYPSGFLQG